MELLPLSSSSFQSGNSQISGHAEQVSEQNCTRPENPLSVIEIWVHLQNFLTPEMLKQLMTTCSYYERMPIVRVVLNIDLAMLIKRDEKIQRAGCDYLKSVNANEFDLTFFLTRGTTKLFVEHIEFVTQNKRGTVLKFEIHCCNGNNWSPQYSNAIAQLTKLESLSISCGDLRGENKKQIGQLRNLKSLMIDSCLNEETGTQVWSGLTNLTLLKLVWTSISADEKEAICNLPKLNTLIVGGDRLRDAGTDWISMLTRLTSLEFRSVDLELLTDCTKNMVGLTALNMTYIKLKETDMENIGGLTNITSLDISDCQVHGDWLSHLSGLKKLTLLSAIENEFGRIGLGNLTCLTGLTSLDVTSSLGKDGSTPISCFTNLESLCMDWNSLSSEGIKPVSGLTRLRVLSLRANVLVADDLNYFSDLRNLSVLDVFDNPIVQVSGQWLDNLSGLRELHITEEFLDEASKEKIDAMAHLDVRNV